MSIYLKCKYICVIQICIWLIFNKYAKAFANVHHSFKVNVSALRSGEISAFERTISGFEIAVFREVFNFFRRWPNPAETIFNSSSSGASYTSWPNNWEPTDKAKTIPTDNQTFVSYFILSPILNQIKGLSIIFLI